MSQEDEPHRNLNDHKIRQNNVEGISQVPDPLYRLRLSVLKDTEGTRDFPIHMFVRTFQTRYFFKFY
jgi:hypothetical protein